MFATLFSIAALVQLGCCIGFHPTQTLAVAKNDPYGAFTDFIRHYSREYIVGTPEYNSRFQIFQANVQMVLKSNADPSNTFTLALNEFADFTHEEFLNSKTGYRADLYNSNVARGKGPDEEEDYDGFRPHGNHYLGLFKPKPGLVVADEHDWRSHGAISPVKNQGSCGSCWAFSAVGAIEALNYIETGEMVKLSEQELLDCMYGTTLECCYGCSGGLMDPAFEFIVQNGGIDTQEDYEYWGAWSWGCNTIKRDDRTVVTISGYKDIPQNEEALKAAVHQQPVSVAVCASDMQFYYSGIVNRCCSTLNHGVVAVGYGTDKSNGQDYWIVRNSWGATWGQEGYIYLERNTGGAGMCGIASAPSMPIKDIPNPEPEEIPDVCYNPIGLSWKECYNPEACCCRLSFFGFFCLWNGCCETAATAAASLPVT